MSIFGEQATVHTKKQQHQTTLAELGGAGAGFGAGMLAKAIGNVHYRDSVLNEAMNHSQDLSDSEDNWKKMIGLHNGTIKMDELNDRDQRKFKRLLEDNAEDLDYLKQNPNKVAPLLKEMGHGKVVPLHPDQASPSKMKRVMEEFAPPKPVRLGQNVEPIFANEERMMMPNIIENPALHALPPFFGLAGMAGAGMLASRHFDKVNESNKNEHDLNRLQEMLNALKEKESQSQRQV